MTDKQFAKQKEPARKEADRIITLSSPEEVTAHLKNISGAIATGMLRHWGWYTCIFLGEKLFFEVAA